MRANPIFKLSAMEVTLRGEEQTAAVTLTLIVGIHDYKPHYIANHIPRPLYLRTNLGTAWE